MNIQFNESVERAAQVVKYGNYNRKLHLDLRLKNNSE
jgi:hypothetical protein